MPKRSLSFTLIELLTVILIIGILVSLTTFSFANSRTKARDSKRKQDLDQISKALESYFQDNQQYPANLGTATNDYRVSTNLSPTTALVPNYIASMPQDPTYNTAMTTGTTGACKDVGTNCNSTTTDKRNYLYAAGPAAAPLTFYALFTYLEKPVAGTDITTVLEYDAISYSINPYCNLTAMSGTPNSTYLTNHPTISTGTCRAAYAISANYSVRTLP